MSFVFEMYVETFTKNHYNYFEIESKLAWIKEKR